MSVLKTRFSGDRGALFQIALKAGLLTALTAGIYRFWKVTRLRRYYWSAVRPGGHPFEYTGTGLEKLVGFCVAVIVLAIVLIGVNTLLIAEAIGAVSSLPTWLKVGVYCAPLTLVFLWFAARYRMRAYLVSRTRWRGIRFGMTSGAWGYAWRSVMYRVVCAMSLGLLVPLMVFRLEKYCADRTWFGTARFTQFGSASSLYGLYLPVPLSFAAGVGLIAWVVLSSGAAMATDIPDPESAGPTTEHIAFGVLGCFLAFSSILFYLNFRVASVGLLTSMKVLGDGVEFDLHPRFGRVFSIYFFGSFATGILISMIAPCILGLALFVMSGFNLDEARMMLFDRPQHVAAVISALTIFTVYTLNSVFREVFIIFPLFKHVATTLEIHEADLLNGIRQRDRDTSRDAGGLADALDVGGAF